MRDIYIGKRDIPQRYKQALKSAGYELITVRRGDDSGFYIQGLNEKFYKQTIRRFKKNGFHYRDIFLNGILIMTVLKDDSIPWSPTTHILIKEDAIQKALKTSDTQTRAETAADEHGQENFEERMDEFCHRMLNLTAELQAMIKAYPNKLESYLKTHYGEIPRLLNSFLVKQNELIVIEQSHPPESHPPEQLKGKIN